jgi:hypothetical protein
VEYPVELSVQCPPTGRGPVTCGVPFPRGMLTDPATLALTDSHGRPVPLQTRTLNAWSDGSVRWLLLDWRAEAGAAPYRLAPGEPAAAPPVESTSTHLILWVDSPGTDPVLLAPVVKSRTVEHSGTRRTTECQRGVVTPNEGEPLADFTLRQHHFADTPTVRYEFTLRNPRAAVHPGGLWDLGDVGSVLIRDIAVVFALPGEGPAVVRCSPEVGAPFEEFTTPFELYQDSSGGENWKHPNHLNRNREVPHTFRGYRIRSGGTERTGLRATPIVVISRGGYSTAVAVPKFWQNFPMAIEATDGGLVLRLFPKQHADVMELQGGEQKTWTFAVWFGEQPEKAQGRASLGLDDLEWFRQPPLAHASPEWYCAAGVVPHLTPRAADPNADYLALVDAAIEGSDTFDHKREKIDEYGWRHFGDIYGDHEAVYHDGPEPMVSHYNNQYDPIAGFAAQFMRSGDPRWFRHMDELAAHVTDIDIYHTDRDKSAYNHGLFWHTYHYAAADTATHRSYPRSLRQMKGMPGLDPSKVQSKSVYALGGGPANEQNYVTGLVLHHFLTGCEASREAALELAQWVIDMDDGGKTIFRFLARGDTGLASKSRDMNYHGPGRGSGNSLAALLDGHTLTGDDKFLVKAERLVLRCIHPLDDVPAMNLLDVENKWFYTMFLQTLGRHLDHKAELGQLDAMYTYARDSLLNYARWMAEHEVPTLSRPEILEYPNETWAAQDLRKCEVFQYAAKHAVGDERAKFLERAEFFFRDSIARLTASPTRTLARPVVLLLSFGFSRAYFQSREVSAPPPQHTDIDFGKPRRFEPQKTRAVRRAKKLVKLGAVVGAALVAGLVWWAVR